MRVSCLRSDDWPDLYYGLFDSDVERVGRHDQHQQVGFRFPEGIGEVECIYLLCQYQAGAPTRGSHAVIVNKDSSGI